MYVSSLLHDLGKLMLLRGDDPEYYALLETTPSEALHLEERQRYGFDHALLAGHVLSAWKLSQPIPRVVGWHHQPGRAYPASGDVPKMVALVRLADHLVALPETVSVEEAALKMAEMPLELKVLGFSEDQIPRLCDELIHLPVDSATQISSAPAKEAANKSLPARPRASLRTMARELDAGGRTDPAPDPGAAGSVVPSAAPIVSGTVSVSPSGSPSEARPTTPTERPRVSPRRRSKTLTSDTPAVPPVSILNLDAASVHVTETAPTPALRQEAVPIAFVAPDGDASDSAATAGSIAQLTSPADTSVVEERSRMRRAMSVSAVASAFFVAGALFGRISAERLPSGIEFGAWVLAVLAAYWVWLVREYALARRHPRGGPSAAKASTEAPFSRRAA
jgi:hypothetical protein